MKTSVLSCFENSVAALDGQSFPISFILVIFPWDAFYDSKPI